MALPVYSQAAYIKEQLTLTNMLSGKDSMDLQKAVYAVENAYYNGNLNEEIFNQQIEWYTNFCRGIMQSGDIRYEGQGDEQAAKAQCAVFVFMTDSIPMQVGDTVAWHTPFEYNFDDYAGRENWNNMFVSRMMETKKGNCHSMPLLYKLIMDKLGKKCWLSLAPNHMYIKAWNKRAGWYNIELTCADFPTDAWLTASGYIHLDAIRNGILLLKAQIVTQQYKQSPSATIKKQMNELYSRIHQLGYRKMPTDMYLNWLYSLNEYSNEYRIKKIVSYTHK